MTASDVEDTPLLAVQEHEKVYERFSTAQKRIIVGLVGWSAILPLFAAGTFIPSIPQIAKDLDADPQTISWAVSLGVLATAIGSLTFATYSAYYGRRAAYLAGSPLLFIGSVGVAMSRHVPEMLVWKCIQAAGTSGGASVGAAVIGDIYKLTERGTAMGIFFGASLLGPAISPAFGGLGAHYFSWRWTQYGLAVAGLFSFVLLTSLLPETSHPGTRGIEKYWQSLPEDSASRGKFKWVWLNPFSCFKLLRSPPVLFVTLCATSFLLTDYALLIPISYTLGERYNLTNEFFVGACYLPLGLGNIIGAPLSGYLSDRAVIRAIKKHGPTNWLPEERLKGSVLGAIFPVPLSVLFSGLITKYIGGPLGLVLNLLCFFMNGIGVDMCLAPLSAYTVDILHDRSAEVLAAGMGIRAMLLAAYVPSVFPSLRHFGIVGTYGIAAGVAWLGCALLILTIRYGKELRGWVDMGYTTPSSA